MKIWLEKPQIAEALDNSIAIESMNTTFLIQEKIFKAMQNLLKRIKNVSIFKIWILTKIKCFWKLRIV